MVPRTGLHCASTSDVTWVSLTVATSGAAALVALLESGKCTGTNPAGVQTPFPFPAGLSIALRRDQHGNDNSRCREKHHTQSAHRAYSPD